MRRLLFLSVIILSYSLYSCDMVGLSGDANENLPPRTFLAVEEVNLPEGERLSSQVRIRWWGDDPDGYVAGYEYCLGESDSCSWIDAGSTTDTLFVLPIPEGDDVADVIFNVRAYDNEGLRDPEGARAIFPIKNSPPEIEFNNIELPPDTTYHFAAFGWIADDPDGFDNLNYIEVAINDTTAEWLQIPVEVNYLGIAINNPDQAVSIAEVFTGRSLQTSGLELQNLRMNDVNTVYIRAIDNSLAVSPVDSVSWYIKRQNSSTLFLFDDERAAGRNALNNYRSLIEEALGYEMDFWDISDGEVITGQGVPLSRALPQLIDPTLQRTLADWDHIYWLSNNLLRNIAFATEATPEFLNQGGSIFVNIPTSRIEEDHPSVTFLPFQRMERIPSGQSSFGIGRDEFIAPSDASMAFDTLYTNSGIANTFPLHLSSDMTSVLKADFQTRPSRLRSGFANNISSINEEKNIAYLGFLLNGIRGFELGENPSEQQLTDRQNLINYLRYILIDELGFEE